MSGASLRRLIHAATASVVLLIPLASLTVLRGVVVAVAIAVLAGDLTRLRTPPFGAWIGRRIPVFRSDEAKQLSGATWLWVGYAIAVWLPERAAAAAILVGALADPAASLVGERFGRSDRKTLVGSGAFLLVAASLVFAVGVGWRAALLAGVLGALLERWPGRLDDNVLVAPVVALAVAVSS